MYAVKLLTFTVSVFVPVLYRARMLLFSIGDIKNLWLLLVLSFFAELRLPPRRHRIQRELAIR
jgi:hypothetical protein